MGAMHAWDTTAVAAEKRAHGTACARLSSRPHPHALCPAAHPARPPAPPRPPAGSGSYDGGAHANALADAELANLVIAEA